MRIIFDYNRTIFDPERDRIYSGVQGLLERLSKKHNLYLVARAEAGRTARLSGLGIRPYFIEIVLVREKTSETFFRLAAGTRALVIGDRLAEEIKIGNFLGYVTVRVRQGKFSTEQPASLAEEPTHVISDIREVEKIIHQYET